MIIRHYCLQGVRKSLQNYERKMQKVNEHLSYLPLLLGIACWLNSRHRIYVSQHSKTSKAFLVDDCNSTACSVIRWILQFSGVLLAI